MIISLRCMEYLRSQESNNHQEASDDDYISKFKKMNEEYVESHKQEEKHQEDISSEVEEESTIEEPTSELQEEEIKEEVPESVEETSVEESTSEIQEEKPELTNDYISKMHDEYLRSQESNQKDERGICRKS